jgi:hypothetical protein
MFGSLAWTQILMNAQYECWIVKSPIPTSDITQETVADRFPWGIPEVAKLSIPVLNSSIGPVQPDRKIVTLRCVLIASGARRARDVGPVRDM